MNVGQAPQSGPAAAAGQVPPAFVQQTTYAPPPVLPPQGAPPQPYQGAYAAPPNYYGGPPGGVVYVTPPAPPMVSIISPEDLKKIRKMQWVNFLCTMLQLGCAVAIICIVRYQLVVYVWNDSGAGWWGYECWAATSDFPGTCDYAYSLAAVSIWIGFMLSLMQCLTCDCCGAGRIFEAFWDAVGFAWWLAGTVYLGYRADEANTAGIPKQSSRNAVVTMAAISAFLFMALLVTNVVLIKRQGKAYKAAVQQAQQRATAHPYAVPMAGTYQAQPGMTAPPPPGAAFATAYPPQSLATTVPAPAGVKDGTYNV